MPENYCKDLHLENSNSQISYFDNIKVNILAENSNTAVVNDSKAFIVEPIDTFGCF